MTKRILMSVLVLGFLLMALTGCSNESSNPTASSSPSPVPLGQQFELRIGQSQSIAGEKLSLTFTDVTADSRCPLGAECIQAGQAKCQLEVTSIGQVYSIELIETGLSAGSASTLMGEYKISFQLIPYPEVGKQIQKSDYQLLIIISR
jgi:hypothetical protein